MKLPKNYDIRENILFNENHNEGNYLGGCRYFIELPPEILQQLIDLKFVDENERINDRPSPKELLEYAKSHKGVTFGGYAVSPVREDYRTSIHFIKQEFTDDYTMVNNAYDFVNHFLNNDMIIDDCFLSNELCWVRFD